MRSRWSFVGVVFLPIGPPSLLGCVQSVWHGTVLSGTSSDRALTEGLLPAVTQSQERGRNRLSICPCSRATRTTRGYKAQTTNANLFLRSNVVPVASLRLDVSRQRALIAFHQNAKPYCREAQSQIIIRRVVNVRSVGFGGGISLRSP